MNIVPKPPGGWAKILMALLCLIAMPLAASLLWSWMGFYSGTDGIILAVGRRLLAGQVPYRDFFLDRPPLAAVLHFPFLWWGGDYVFWGARAFIWFQLALTAWLWAGLMDRYWQQPFGRWGQILMTAAGMVFAGNHATRLHPEAVNALCLAMVGLSITVRSGTGTGARWIGYLIMGLAALCAQNFILLAPAVLIGHGDGRRTWRGLPFWLAIVTPIALFLAYLSYQVALAPAWAQLVIAPRDFYRIFQSYFGYRSCSYGSSYCVGTYVALRWLTGRPAWHFPTTNRRVQTGLGIAVIGVLLFMILRAMFLDSMNSAYIAMLDWPAGEYLVFWIAFGGLMYYALEDRAKLGAWALGVWLAVSLAATSIERPIQLAAGLLVVLVIIGAVIRIRWLWVRGLILIAITAIGVTFYHYNQWTQPGQDAPAKQLTCPLGDALAGARGIYTSTNVYETMADLQRAVALAGRTNCPYAIIPDPGGYWATAPQANPLASDWLNKMPGNFRNQIADEIGKRRGQLVVIVQKNRMERLWDHPQETSDGRSYLKNKFKLWDQTKYFTLYW